MPGAHLADVEPDFPTVETAASELKATTDHASDVMDSDQKPNGIAPSEKSVVDAPTADVTEDEPVSETSTDPKRALSKNALMQKPGWLAQRLRPTTKDVIQLLTNLE